MQAAHQSKPYCWEKFTGSIPPNAVHCGNYVVIQAHHGGQWLPGKLHKPEVKAYIPYDGKEVHVQNEIEVLVQAPGAEVQWVNAAHGEVPADAVASTDPHMFVGRAVCPQPENQPTPGKIHPSHKCLYLPWGDKEHKYEQYEVLVIKRLPAFHWEKFAGKVPSHAVKAHDDYVVIKAKLNGDWIPGKLYVPELKAYVPYDSKENHVTHDIEVLVHAPGAEVRWVAASHGQIPPETVGPIGNEGVFVGRAVCPQPENKPTPGKIHSGHKCLYMPWGDKEHKVDSYEACVITYPGHKHHHH